jgi:hypothetical protein
MQDNSGHYLLLSKLYLPKAKHCKGEYFPSEEVCDRLLKVIDETIARLRNSIDENNQNSCP